MEVLRNTHQIIIVWGSGHSGVRGKVTVAEEWDSDVPCEAKANRETLTSVRKKVGSHDEVGGT